MDPYFRALSQKKMTGDYVLFENWYLLDAWM